MVDWSQKARGMFHTVLRSVDCRPPIHAPPPHHDAILYLTLLVFVNAGQRLTPYVMRMSYLSSTLTFWVPLCGIRKTTKAGAGADGAEV